MAFSTFNAAAQQHFAVEEARMLESRYPDIKPHCQSHRHLLDSLISFQFKIINGQTFPSTMGPHEFLRHWFVEHVANDDKKLADFLAQRGSEPSDAAS